MYQPAHFQVQDEAQMLALMAAHPLAALVHAGAGGDAFDADHIPLQWHAATRSLRGHVARANPLWQQAQALGESGLPVMAIFRAEQAYVSPNGYPSKAQTHKVVPTWNYAIVHVQGKLKVHDDAEWVHALVSSLTTQHEASEPRPWATGDAPADYMQMMLRAVVGIELEVISMAGKFKLSQNRSTEDQKGVIENLLQRGDVASAAMAQRMRLPS